MRKFLEWVKRLLNKPVFVKFEFKNGEWVESKHGLVCLKTSAKTAISYDCNVFDIKDNGEIYSLGLKESKIYHSFIDEPNENDNMALMREIIKEGNLTTILKYIDSGETVCLEIQGDYIFTLTDTYDNFEIDSLTKG